MPPKAALLKKDEGAAHSIQARRSLLQLRPDTFAQTNSVILILRLQNGGGPYIPSGGLFTRNRPKAGPSLHLECSMIYRCNRLVFVGAMWRPDPGFAWVGTKSSPRSSRRSPVVLKPLPEFRPRHANVAANVNLIAVADGSVDNPVRI